ncbi:MAG TPA: hypothetical protein VH760_00600 [Gaiellaceae bacterium]|jgi:hypothetical protein
MPPHLVVAVAWLGVGAAAAGAGPLSPAPGSSVVAPLLLTSSIDMDGIGCGVPATWTTTLPAGAFDGHVRKPVRGVRSLDARVAAVAVRGRAVTITAIADSREICDPGADQVPPESRRWSAGFPLEVAFARRETTAVVADWRLRNSLVVRPNVVSLRAYTQDATDTVVKVRWKQYGGRKAVGFGIFKAAPFFCPSPARCSRANGQPVRVELSRPSYCPGANIVAPGKPVKPFVFYGSISAFNMRRIGVIKLGTNFQGYEPRKSACLGAATRIP